jgi:hypothetical protein
MTKIERFLAALPGLALFFAACSEGKQPVSGTVAQESFSSPITTVTASRSDATSTSASVAADGTFTLNLPKGSGYRLDFTSAAGDTTLVFPRSGGAVEWRFDVTGTGSKFDLGTIRPVGDLRTMKVTFAHQKGKHGDGGVDDDVTCVNGLDPTTGAVCVEDDDQGLACKDKGGKHGKGKGHEKAKGHGDAGCPKRHMCEDDAGMCKGDGDEDGDGHHGHDGGLDDDDNTTGTDTTSATGEPVPTNAAVADRNLPASIGKCGDRDEGEDDK